MVVMLHYLPAVHMLVKPTIFSAIHHGSDSYISFVAHIVVMLRIVSCRYGSDATIFTAYILVILYIVRCPYGSGVTYRLLRI